MSELYLSRIPTRRLLAVAAIRSYYDTAISRHRLVMGVFPQMLGDSPREKASILFRVERASNEGLVYIQSSITPANISGLETREHSVDFSSGDLVRFRVTFTPSVRNGSKERFISDQDELESLLRMRLSGGLASISIVNTKDETIQRDKTASNFLKLTQVDGVATVDNLEKLTELVKRGVGRNRNYGAGLLTLSKIG